MARLELKESETLKSLITLYNGITKELVFKITTNELSMSSMDGAHVILIESFLPKSCFKRFEVTEACFFGINVGYVKQLLLSANPEYPVRITKNTNADKFNIQIYSKVGRRAISYDIKELNLDISEFHIPEEEYDGIALMSIKEFGDLLKSIQIGVVDDIRVKSDGNRIIFMMSGEEGEMKFPLESDLESDEYRLKVNVIRPFSQSFAIKNVLKSHLAKGSETVAICFKQDRPMLLQYAVAGTGRICAYIAPKEEEGNMGPEKKTNKRKAENQDPIEEGEEINGEEEGVYTYEDY